MRGEGAQLRNSKGEVFMHRYHPMAALAPRDIVSRAIWAEMAATKSRHVYLDVTHLGAEFVKRRFPTIYSTACGTTSTSPKSGSRCRRVRIT